jgi:hypothetical protein
MADYTVLTLFYLLLPPFQIVSRFGFSRCIDFAMHLGLEQREYLTVILDMIFKSQNNLKFGTKGVLNSHFGHDLQNTPLSFFPN